MSPVNHKNMGTELTHLPLFLLNFGADVIIIAVVYIVAGVIAVISNRRWDEAANETGRNQPGKNCESLSELSTKMTAHRKHDKQTSGEHCHEVLSSQRREETNDRIHKLKSKQRSEKDDGRRGDCKKHKGLQTTKQEECQ